MYNLLLYGKVLVCLTICINLYTFEVYVFKISAFKLHRIIKLLIPKHGTLINKHPVLALMLRLALAMYNRLGPLSWWSHMFMTLWKLTALVDPCNNRWCLPPHSVPWLSLCMHLKFFTSHFDRSCLQLVHLRQALASRILSVLASTSSLTTHHNQRVWSLLFPHIFPSTCGILSILDRHQISVAFSWWLGHCEAVLSQLEEFWRV